MGRSGPRSRLRRLSECSLSPSQTRSDARFSLVVSVITTDGSRETGGTDDARDGERTGGVPTRLSAG